MTRHSKDTIGETVEDIERKVLSKHSKLIIKNIKKIAISKFDIFLIEPKLPDDFKGFLQRVIMLIDEMGAEETIYRPETNSITFWYD